MTGLDASVGFTNDALQDKFFKQKKTKGKAKGAGK